ncbi:FG-GAP repeat domain-containing protein [Ruegeria hyattellae]|uniref:FG-GAP repeat domain-containing protein n=1 Tax=Ruegeria hyattellae TaxID=3233337 RepID=UPI00355C46CE
MHSTVAAAFLALCPLLPVQAQTIVDAEYFAPTDSYPHGVLGDDQEWGAVQITVKRQRGEPGSLISGYVNLTYRIDALPDTVFEDLEPRLWDVTGDGSPEVVVVESHQSYGARLMVIGLQDGELRYIAATPYIGTRFRWLAPVGAADLDGDGHVEIAFIDRPHLAQMLRIWRFKDDALTEIAAIPGFANHRIGEDFISGGLRNCGAGPELIVVSGDWSRIAAVAFHKRWVERHVGPYTGPESLTAALAC